MHSSFSRKERLAGKPHVYFHGEAGWLWVGPYYDAVCHFCIALDDGKVFTKERDRLREKYGHE